MNTKQFLDTEGLNFFKSLQDKYTEQSIMNALDLFESSLIKKSPIIKEEASDFQVPTTKAIVDYVDSVFPPVPTEDGTYKLQVSNGHYSWIKE